MTISNATAEILRAAVGVGFLPLGPGVTPTAPVDSEWLAQAGWGYSGVAPFWLPAVDRYRPFVYRTPRRMRCKKRSLAV